MKIINLINLNESVTFELDLRQQNERISDMGGLSFFAADIFYKYIKNNKPFYYKFLSNSEFRSIKFDIDGLDDWDSPTGTINVYVRENGINDHFLNDFKASIEYVVQQLSNSVKVGTVKYEGHKKDYKSSRSVLNQNFKSSELGVVRIPIIENNNNVEKLPTLNLANDNAKALLNLIGINSNDELYGTISIKDIPKILMRLRNISNEKITFAQRDDYSNRNFHVAGLPKEQILNYINYLIELLELAKRKNVDVIYN